MLDMKVIDIMEVLKDWLDDMYCEEDLERFACDILDKIGVEY